MPGRDARELFGQRIDDLDCPPSFIDTGDIAHPCGDAQRKAIDRSARGKVVAHVLGNHIEQTRSPYLDYPIGTVYQPDEHSLELGRSQLLELNEACATMNGKARRIAFRDFTIWPH